MEGENDGLLRRLLHRLRQLPLHGDVQVAIRGLERKRVLHRGVSTLLTLPEYEAPSYLAFE